jgi:hypothetical protein
MALRDSDCKVNVRMLFEELIRAHEDAEPLVRPPGASSGSERRSPPRRRRSELPCWESDREQTRVAELAQLLTPPDIDVLAPRHTPPAEHDPAVLAPGALDLTCSARAFMPPRAPDAESRQRRVLSSLAPVAIPVAAKDARDPVPSYGAGHAVRWLIPVSASVFALGALMASGRARIAPDAAASWEAAQAAEASLASPEVDGELAAAVCSDLLAQGDLIAAELIAGPAMALSETTAPGGGRPSGGTASDSVRRQTLGLGPVDGAAAAPPPGSASARAWNAAAKLSRTSGRHIGSESGVTSAKPEQVTTPFDTQAARNALQRAAAAAAACGDAGTGTQLVPASVTFAPSGRATMAQVGGALAGTAAGSCVALALRSASVPAFSGAAVTVRKTVRVP